MGANSGHQGQAAPPHNDLGLRDGDFAQLVGGMPDALLVHKDERIAYANPACAKLFRATSPAALLGRHISEIVPAGELGDVMERIREHHRTGGVLPPAERVLVALDGARIHVEVMATVCTWDGSEAIEVVLRDISDRKNAEQRASEWERRLLLAQKAGLQIGLWEWNFSNDTLVWSDEICRLFGYTRETFQGTVQEFHSRIHPDDRDKVYAASRKVLEGYQEYGTEFRVVRPDGSLAWLKSHGVVVNSSTRMIGIAVDVTGMKEAEQFLRESEENYRLLLDSTAEGIYGLDLNGFCTFCNPAAARLLGYEDPAQLIGTFVHGTHHSVRSDGTPYPDSECRILEGFRRGDGIHADNELFLRADGTIFPTEYRSYPIRRGSEVIGAVVTFADITERVEAEHRLRESETKYRSIVANAPYGIYRSTVDGHISMANPALVRMLGYATEAEVLSLKLEPDVYANPEQRAEVLARAVSVGRVDAQELEWKRKDGSRITVSASGVPVRDSVGNVKEFQVIVQDITERKNLERQFWLAQKMEAVGRLAGGVAHDFNNVLMIVSSYSELILQLDVNNDKLTRYAEQIHQAAMKAGSVVQQLLAFSRKQMLEPEILDLNSVVSELGKMLPKLLGEDIEYITRLNDPLQRVKVDRGQLEQIIVNLAVNARDAMPKGGRLVIETRDVHLDEKFAAQNPPTIPGEYVQLVIADTGVGMDSETKARIFEPFFTTKERGKGTGLGLATVYGIVKQSGGFIWVHSHPGEGTSFEIYFPATKQAAARSGVPHLQRPVAAGSETILVVEDEPGLRASIGEFLERVGYKIIVASDAAEALAAADRYDGSIDGVLTDIVIPGMDGVELSKILKRKHPHCRVLFMSGYTDRNIEGLGAESTLLRKPVSLSVLAVKLREVLGSSPGLL